MTFSVDAWTMMQLVIVVPYRAMDMSYREINYGECFSIRLNYDSISYRQSGTHLEMHGSLIHFNF